MEEEEKPTTKYKFILLGDAGVGKTNILSRILNDDFSLGTQSTITMEFGKKNVTLNDKSYNLQIWDTAGQEKYRSMTKSYIKGSKAALVVYDITRSDTFKAVDLWIQDIRDMADNDCIIQIIGNKTDLENQRQVSSEEGKKKADSFNVLFEETSALEATNINEAFDSLLQEVIKLDLKNVMSSVNDGNPENVDKNLSLKPETQTKKEEKKKKKCC